MEAEGESAARLQLPPDLAEDAADEEG